MDAKVVYQDAKYVMLDVRQSARDDLESMRNCTNELLKNNKVMGIRINGQTGIDVNDITWGIL